MFTKEVLGLYPQKRIKAFDGMAVTADVWDESHDYHRMLLSIHTRFAHGAGIVYGLEVIAGEPPDRQVYVQPGIAVDPLGRTVVLPEQRAYDLRAIEGLVYIVLSYGESQPRVDSLRAAEDAPRFIHAEYALEALVSLPPTPHIELARVRRQAGGAPVSNALNPDLPGLNEIDLRFRKRIGVTETKPATVAVVSLMSGRDSGAAAGVANLARAMERAGGRRVIVEPQPPLDRSLQNFALVYLVGQHVFRLTTDQMTALYDYWRQGGTIFYESCRDSLSVEPDGDKAFLDLMSSMGVSLQPLTQNHPLLHAPHLFTAPPDGYETQGTPRFLVSEGALFSTYDFGSIWQGKRRVRPATRTEIRNAFEWGENLIEYASQRRK